MTVASLPPAGRIYRAYYFAGAQRVAVRERYPQGFGADKVSYLLSDHLGSTSVTYNASTGAAVTQLYKPWGEVRYASGALPTDYTYTGQYSNTANFGLMYYRARWYDPSLGRFSQADTVVPGAMAIDFDRYAYVRNSPTGAVDPSGHLSDDQVRDLIKFSKNDSAWDEWKSNNIDLYNQLIAANSGDIFRFTLSDTKSSKTYTYNWMVVETEQGYRFYDTDARKGIDLPDWFSENTGMIQGAGIMRDVDGNGTYESSDGSYYGNVLLTPYELPSGWQGGSNGQVVIVKELIANPECFLQSKTSAV